jgi:CBS domain-containing protein
MKVRDVMTVDPVTITPEMSLRALAEVLSERRISGAPVVDHTGHVTGIVSEADLLLKQGPERPRRRGALGWIAGEHGEPDQRRAASTVAGVMSSPAITIRPDRSIREAAELMLERRVNRLPVVDDGRLVGIIARADLVRAYLRSDEEIRRAVREEVLRRDLWLDPAGFDIEVHDGIVCLRGRADRRSTARIIGRLTQLVDGVVSVRNQIGWDLDDHHLAPATTGEPEPTAASITAREHPRPMTGGIS